MKRFLKIVLGNAIIIGTFALIFTLGTTDKGRIYHNDNQIIKNIDSNDYIAKEGDYGSLKFLYFDGTETVYASETSSNQKFYIDYEIDCGDFKVVRINEDGVVQELLPGYYDFNNDEDSFRIKIVGDNAVGMFSILVEEN
jgi:hypothetical protein